MNPNGFQQDETEEIGLVQAVSVVKAIAFPMILKTALEMGVLDVISAAGNGAYVSPSEIASGLPTIPTNPDAPVLLDRMMRLLATHSILRCRTVRTGEKTERLYGIGPVGRFFVQNGNEDLGSLAHMFLLFHDDLSFQTWQQMRDMVTLGGDGAFKRAHGTELFEYTGLDQRLNQLFNRAMSGFTKLVMKKVLEVYPGFQDLTTLVDVGGGIGTNLGMITAKYPHIKAVNFDLPVVVANAPSYPGVEHVGGDMFVEVPKGDAIYMKWILHDWNDESCIKILKNCYEALPEDGKLICVEAIHSEKPETDDIYSKIVSCSDVAMMTHCTDGKERTPKEFEALAIDSGFSSCRFICRACHCWVMEFQKGLSV